MPPKKPKPRPKKTAASKKVSPQAGRKRLKVAGRTVTIKQEERVYSGFLNIDQASLIHPRFDGRRQTVTRQSLERGDSVALLLVDKSQRTVWLTEQFRYPTMRKGPGWIAELPAGKIDPGETPQQAALREAVEEIGCAPHSVESIGCFYLSPGGSSERLELFYADMTGKTRDANLAARLQDSDEDIRIIEQPLETFLKAAADGGIDDAKTLIGGLWLLAHRSRLQI